MSSPLTPKQLRFVQEYLIDLNATQAAIRAGYNPKMAPQQASRLLTNVKVGEAVANAQAATAERAQATAKRAQMTVDDHLERLRILSEGAEHEGQFAAAITAETNRGKVVGFYVERANLTIKDPSKMSDAELEAEVQRLKRRTFRLA